MNLAQLRINAGLTQQELGRRMGVQQSRIAHIERTDPAILQIKTIHRYVTALGGNVHIEGKITITAHVDDETWEMTRDPFDLL
jgi:transcriptional regulator with XRE-family HTH domain